MDERNGQNQTEEERLKVISKRIADSEQALAEMIVSKEPKSKTEDYVIVGLELGALETCVFNLLSARSELYRWGSKSLTNLLEKMEKVDSALLTQMFNSRSGDYLKSSLGEMRDQYRMLVIDNLLIMMLWQFVANLIRSSKDVETMRAVMGSFVPVVQKFKDMIDTKEREPETVKGIVESFWADLQKRGVVQ
jgi:hypothetical protein